MIKNFLHYIRQKLSVRVSLWVVFFAAIIFNIALGFLFYQAREAVRQEAISRATQILENTSLRVEGILNRAVVASNMTKWLVERHPDKPDSMFVYSRGMLLNNPDFYNCSIAFEPNHFSDKGRYFSAYTKHVGDSLRTIQGGNDNYQYFYMDWYLMPSLLNKPCWTEPYMDLDVTSGTSEMVTSYCHHQRCARKDNWRRQYQPLYLLALTDHLVCKALPQFIQYHDWTWRHLFRASRLNQDYPSDHIYADARRAGHCADSIGTCHAAR
jgi:hypothetical protein